jgi:hypothetical protein
MSPLSTASDACRCFRRIVAILGGAKGTFYQRYVRMPHTNAATSASRLSGNKFDAFTDKCVGAIDGTHTPVCASASDRARYRNRKGYLSQNVLAACTFDLKFIYVLSGWEGSAPDSRLWADARQNDFPLLDDHYLLADAGFAISNFLCVPYRGVRYHLREWEAAGLRYYNTLHADH